MSWRVWGMSSSVSELSRCRGADEFAQPPALEEVIAAWDNIAFPTAPRISTCIITHLNGSLRRAAHVQTIASACGLRSASFNGSEVAMASSLFLPTAHGHHHLRGPQEAEPIPAKQVLANCILMEQ